MDKKVWCSVSDGNQYWFQIFRNATSHKQKYLQIDMLDVCMSVKHIIHVIIEVIGVTSWSPSLWYCYTVWKDMNHRTTQTVNKDNLKWLEVTEVSYNNAWMRNSPVCTGAIHTRKHYWYGLCKKKADDLYWMDIYLAFFPTSDSFRLIGSHVFLVKISDVKYWIKVFETRSGGVSHELHTIIASI